VSLERNTKFILYFSILTKKYWKQNSWAARPELICCNKYSMVDEWSSEQQYKASVMFYIPC
jgi:hypothetical protein